MNIKCPVCEKEIMRDDMALSAHLRSHIHRKEITKAKAQRIRHKIGFLKQPEQPVRTHEENHLTKQLGIR